MIRSMAGVVKSAIAALVAGMLIAGAATAEDGHTGYVLKGFRSAHFGMSLTQVRAAITKDFKLRGSAIQESVAAIGRTPILGVKVPSLFSQSGGAEVAYLFGYKSQKLAQISVLWAAQTDSGLTSSTLRVDGAILQRYFVGLGYPPKQVVVNGVTSDGLVLFQGTDAQGHVAVLVLQGDISKSKDGQTVLRPEVLHLEYLADPQHPDVMKSLAGQF